MKVQGRLIQARSLKSASLRQTKKIRSDTFLTEYIYIPPVIYFHVSSYLSINSCHDLIPNPCIYIYIYIYKDPLGLSTPGSRHYGLNPQYSTGRGSCFIPEVTELFQPVSGIIVRNLSIRIVRNFSSKLLAVIPLRLWYHHADYSSHPNIHLSSDAWMCIPQSPGKSWHPALPHHTETRHNNFGWLTIVLIRRPTRTVRSTATQRIAYITLLKVQTNININKTIINLKKSSKIIIIVNWFVLQSLLGVRGKDDATETGRRATPQATVVIVTNRTLKII